MLRFLTGGESHGPCLTVIVDGLPAGLPLTTAVLDRDLARRQVGYGRGGRMAIERDRAQILSGVLGGYTTGAPVTVQIANRDWPNWREHWEVRDLPVLSVPRPGHADYAGMIKYGLDDARPVLERASARETAARVAAGALARALLSSFEIAVGSYVTEIGGETARIPDLPPDTLWALAEESDVRCPDAAATSAFHAAIDTARASGESLGGIFVVAAVRLPVGLGSYVQWDRRLDARLAAALMSIPAVKGIEIGPAFENARLPGTQVHDAFLPPSAGADPGSGGPTRGMLRRRSNRAGGIEGGMTNGEPLILRAAMKPIPTTLAPQQSVDLATRTTAATQYQRSDVCAVPAAAVVGEAMVAWILADAVVEKYGGDHLKTMLQRVEEDRK